MRVVLLVVQTTLEEGLRYMVEKVLVGDLLKIKAMYMHFVHDVSISTLSKDLKVDAEVLRATKQRLLEKFLSSQLVKAVLKYGIDYVESINPLFDLKNGQLTCRLCGAVLTVWQKNEVQNHIHQHRDYVRLLVQDFVEHLRRKTKVG